MWPSWFPRLEERGPPITVPWFDHLWQSHGRYHHAHPLTSHHHHHHPHPHHGAMGEGHKVARKGWSLPPHSSPSSSPSALFPLAPSSLFLDSISTWDPPLSSSSSLSSSLSSSSAALPAALDSPSSVSSALSSLLSPVAAVVDGASAFLSSALSPSTATTFTEICLSLDHGAVRLKLDSPTMRAHQPLPSALPALALRPRPFYFRSNALEATLTMHHDPLIPNEFNPAFATIGEASLHLRHRGRSYALHGATFVTDFPLQLSPRYADKGPAGKPGLGFGLDYFQALSKNHFVGGGIQTLTRVDERDDSFDHSVVVSFGWRFFGDGGLSLTTQLDSNQEVKMQVQQRITDSLTGRVTFNHCPFVEANQSVYTASLHGKADIESAPSTVTYSSRCFLSSSWTNQAVLSLVDHLGSWLRSYRVCRADLRSPASWGEGGPQGGGKCADRWLEGRD